mmetsp:Transcript_41438/g.129784  ORF Transcript_41438/g.129784 Transcript_41438/m.129784 type:complete len:105 (+) Transcript_41438:166-480(+)
MSKGGPLFSAADLQAGAKGLEDAGPAESKGAKSGGGDDKESFSMIDTLEALYEKHNGDIRSIFDELGENPGKCLKYPPADAKEFAERYFDGGYTYVDQDKGGSK